MLHIALDYTILIITRQESNFSMGQNGKDNPKTKQSILSKGKDSKSIVRGTLRVNSAISSSSSNHIPNRLRRSQSVEHSVNSIKRDSALTTRKMLPFLSGSDKRTVVSNIHMPRTANIPKDFNHSPKKRRPFSFSKEFEMVDPVTINKIGDGTTGLQRLRKNQSFEGTTAEVRSPRVHFSDSVILLDRQTSVTSDNNYQDDDKIEESNYDLKQDRHATGDNTDNRCSVHEIAERESAINRSVVNDKLMMAKTDELITDVSRFIQEINYSRTNNSFPVETEGNLNTSQNLPHHEDSESIKNVAFPNSSTKINSARSTIISIPNCEVVRLSRPSSASSMIRSVSNDDIHGRISLTLRMIEKEEQRQREIMDLKSSSIPDNLHDILISENNYDAVSNNQRESDYYQMSLPSVSNYGSRPSSRSSISSQQQLLTFQGESFLGTSCQLEEASSSPLFKNFSTENIPKNNFTLKLKGESDKLSTRRDETETQGSSSNEKVKKIFSFLDEVEKSDRETYLGLIYEPSSSAHPSSRGGNSASISNNENPSNIQKSTGTFLQKVDSLIRKGSVELAKEQIILERKLEESQQRIQVLEETLIHQRELNMRNLRSSERDLKKRLKLQKEEFDAAFARTESLINEMAAEKRILQERCDKLMKHFDDTEEKYKEQIKSLQQKHLDEIKRLRKAQINSEHAKKQQWMGTKTQEIREMTVKGLEPEVQRIIQRHQQEMSEMRAWHLDELRETEERCQRKLNMQLQDIREKMSKEAEEIIIKEKELISNRYETALKQREEEFEAQRRRLLHELQEEKAKFSAEEDKWKETLQENVRKAQIKGEVEIENLKHEHEAKMSNVERKHVDELNSLKDVQEMEKEALVNKLTKKYEAMLQEKDAQLTSSFKSLMDAELREREKKLKEEFEKIRHEDEISANLRLKRIQEKLNSDLEEMDKSEKELKGKLNQTKSQLLLLEEQIYSLKTNLSLKEKQSSELQEANYKMLEERANLTSVIRREFAAEIEGFENDIRGMKNNIIEIQSKHKLELEQRQLEMEKLSREKETEMDKIELRVQQAIGRKDETIQGLQKQIEKCNFTIQHLEGLLEEQRKNLVDSMTKTSNQKRTK